MRNRLTRRLLHTAAILVATAAFRVAPARAGQAEDILKASGVRGGLVVHVGCGEGTLTTALRASDSYLVHGLDTDAAKVGKARVRIQSAGLAGAVSVSQFDGAHLPFVDNLANLVVAEDLGKVPLAEVLRVLCPGGVAYVARNDAWSKTVKPRPSDIDEWSHYLHDASGNAVAHDTVIGPPRHMQWVADPTWSRNHHKLASVSSVVSEGGRIFYIVDEAPSASMKLPGKWFLAGRDAFNGTLLWQRRMNDWAYTGQGFRSGPVQLPRTLVAGGGRVYAPLGLSAPVSALDAATGKVAATYADTQGAEELILADGILYVVAGSPRSEQAGLDPARRGQAKYPNTKSVIAVDVASGKTLWKWTDTEAARLIPLTLAAADGRVFLAAGTGVECLNAKTGKGVWAWPAGVLAAKGAKGNQAKRAANQAKGDKKKRAPRGKAGGDRRPGWSTATLVVSDGVVLYAGGGKLTALTAEAGKPLWNCPARPGFRSPTDVFAISGLVWMGSDFTEGRDIRTGEVKKTSDVMRKLRTAGHHHRCYREKATDRYILGGHRGIEFMDLIGEEHSRNNWIRGLCQYGILPCNGLIYAPPHACGCYMEAKLIGFWATAPERKSEPTPAQTPRLLKGPAYGEIRNPQSAIRNQEAWPTYRGNALRTGATTASLPAKLASDWQTKIGGHLSAPVSAGGLVLVAAVDSGRVCALDAGTGKERWSFAAGGRVDSPPTIHAGRALFGCADGWAYCLRVSDGQLAWKFRAAPEDRRTVARDRVESVWPLHGSVLVHRGVAYVAAGRYSYLDGGIHLFGLDPATGEVRYTGQAVSKHPKALEGYTGDGVKKLTQNATDSKTFQAPDKSDSFSMSGARSDVLVSDGESVFLRHMRFDASLSPQPKMTRHLLSTSRLIDDGENHRSHWVLGTGDFSRTPVAYSWIANRTGGAYGSRLSVPYGLMLSYDDKTVWGVRRTGRDYGYFLFAESNKPFDPSEPHLPDFRKQGPDNKPSFTWQVPLTMRPTAILRAGEVLLLGGMPMQADDKDPLAAYEGRRGGMIWAMSTKDGSKLAEIKLSAPPVWDSLATAGGKLYATTADGKVICLGAK